MSWGGASQELAGACVLCVISVTGLTLTPSPAVGYSGASTVADRLCQS